MGLLIKIVETFEDLKVGRKILVKIKQIVEQYRDEKIEIIINRSRLTGMDYKLKEKGHTEFSKELQAQIQKLEEKEVELEKNLEKSISAIVATKPNEEYLIMQRYYDARISASEVVGQTFDTWLECDKKREVASEVTKLIGEEEQQNN